jgi:hypothetical protein
MHPINANLEGEQTLQEQAFIHYNGWGARWDEWVPTSSTRLAPFRTHTVQNPRSLYMCPHPNINPDPTTGFLADVQPAYTSSNPNDSLYAA